MIDEWCEQRMWQALNIETNGVEPLCAITGFAFLIIPFMYPVKKMSLRLIAVYSGFVLLGLGTIVFHSIRNVHEWGIVNINSFDWFPLIFVCALIFYMFLYPLFEFCSNFINFLIMFLFISWFAFLLMTVDYANFESMDNLVQGSFDYASIVNLILLLPLAICLFLYTCFGYSLELFPIWIYIIIGAFFWLLNTYLCEKVYFLATFHAIYHIIISIALWKAACVANELTQT
jgi:hypothetical protein